MSLLSHFFLSCALMFIANVAGYREGEVLEYVSPPFVEVAEDAFSNQEIASLLRDPSNYNPSWGKAGIAYSIIYYMRNARLAAQYAPKTFTYKHESQPLMWSNLFRMEMAIFNAFRDWFDHRNDATKWQHFVRIVHNIFSEKVKHYLQHFSTSDSFAIRMPVYKDNGLGAKFALEMTKDLPTNVQLDKENPFIALFDDTLPLIGFGSWPLVGERCKDAVLKALKTGYRLIDTSENYNNEKEIGEAMRESGVDRKDILIASKLSYNQNYGKGVTREAFEKTLDNLGVDYMDVYMLHGAIGDKQRLREAWAELETLHKEGKIKYLAVSNFDPHDMSQLMTYSTIKPLFVQNKFDPFTQGQQTPWTTSIERWVVNYNENIRKADEDLIVIQGYCVLNAWPHQISAVKDKHIEALANLYQVTPAQLLIRWALQHKYIGILTRSSREERQLENLNMFDFEINDVDMQLINGLNTLFSPFDIDW
eukprot:69837_1